MIASCKPVCWPRSWHQSRGDQNRPRALSRISQEKAAGKVVVGVCDKIDNPVCYRQCTTRFLALICTKGTSEGIYNALVILDKYCIWLCSFAKAISVGLNSTVTAGVTLNTTNHILFSGLHLSSGWSLRMNEEVYCKSGLLCYDYWLHSCFDKGRWHVTKIVIVIICLLHYTHMGTVHIVLGHLGQGVRGGGLKKQTYKLVI